MGIYNAVWQLGDYEQGRWFSYMAERVPNRPEFVARMREYVERQSGKYDLAYRLNLEYMLRYIDDQNEVEARLTSMRFWDILNRWNLSEMIQAARRFIEAEGRDPRSLEELVKSSAWKALRLPTMESLRDTIGRYRDVPPSLQAHLDAIAREAIIPIPGAPPEPNGYSYRIIESLIPKDGETTGTLPVTRENAFHLPDSHFAYIINEYDTRERMRRRRSPAALPFAAKGCSSRSLSGTDPG